MKILKLGYYVLPLLIGSFGFAQMQYPPELSSERSIKNFAKKIRRLVPDTTSKTYGLTNAMERILTEEQTFVKRLKENDDYVASAKERGPLQTFLLETVETKTEPPSNLSAAWTDLLKANAFEGETTLGADRQLTDIFDKWPTMASVHFFSGWASLLAREDRRILSEPDLLERWQKIKEALAKQDINELRSKFNAARYGMVESNWQLADFDEFVQSVDDVEARIIALMEVMQLGRGGPWILADNLPEFGALINSSNRPPLEKMLLTLKNRALKIYTRSENEKHPEPVPRQIILREIPPYLALYRGCVGKDCSTGLSTHIPYIPNERNWWIEDKNGVQLGYVAGSITKVKRKTSLYIHDVAGPGIAIDDIPLILTGIYQIRKSYGAEVMTIMSHAFTRENHRGELALALRNYGKHFIRLVRQAIPHKDIRKLYFANGGSYDNAAQHTDVRQILPTKKLLAAYRATAIKLPKPGSLIPNENPDLFWRNLSSAAKANDRGFLDDAYGRGDFDWKSLIDTMRNKQRLPIKDYYSAIKNEFERRGLPYSNNLMKKNEFIFLEGHLRAADAFTGDNVRLSIRYVMDILWRTSEPNDAIPWIQNNLELLENSDLMIRNVRTLFVRRQIEDFQRLSVLDKAGYQFLKQDFTEEQLKWFITEGRIPTGLALLAINKKLAELPHPLTAFKISEILFNRINALFNRYPLDDRVGPLVFGIRDLVNRTLGTRNTFLNAIGSNSDPKLRFLLAMAYLRDSEAVDLPQYFSVFETMILISKRPIISEKLRREAKKIFDQIPIAIRRQHERTLNEKAKAVDLPPWYLKSQCENQLTDLAG